MLGGLGLGVWGLGSGVWGLAFGVEKEFVAVDRLGPFRGVRVRGLRRLKGLLRGIRRTPRRDPYSPVEPLYVPYIVPIYLSSPRNSP